MFVYRSVTVLSELQSYKGASKEIREATRCYSTVLHMGCNIATAICMFPRLNWPSFI